MAKSTLLLVAVSTALLSTTATAQLGAVGKAVSQFWRTFKLGPVPEVNWPKLLETPKFKSIDTAFCRAKDPSEKLRAAAEAADYLSTDCAFEWYRLHELMERASFRWRKASLRDRDLTDAHGSFFTGNPTDEEVLARAAQLAVKRQFRQFEDWSKEWERRVRKFPEVLRRALQERPELCPRELIVVEQRGSRRQFRLAREDVELAHTRFQMDLRSKVLEAVGLQAGDTPPLGLDKEACRRIRGAVARALGAEDQLDMCLYPGTLSFLPRIHKFHDLVSWALGKSGFCMSVGFLSDHGPRYILDGREDGVVLLKEEQRDWR